MTERNFCRYCGSPLVDVVEHGPLHDPETGEPIQTVWRQCVRYPRNSFVAYFRGGLHESFERDNPVSGRRWR